MERLTQKLGKRSYKIPEKDRWHDVYDETIDKIVNKLGQLEDLEEGLGGVELTKKIEQQSSILEDIKTICYNTISLAKAKCPYYNSNGNYDVLFEEMTDWFLQQCHHLLNLIDEGE